MAGHSTPAVAAAHSRRVRRFFACLAAYGVVLITAAVAAHPAGAQGGMTLCHATGNPGQPYIEITVGPSGPGAHFGHENDIIPAPAGGCPTSTEPAATPTPTPAPTVEPTPTATPAPQETPEPVAQPEERSSQTDEDEEDDGESASGRKDRGGGGGAGRTTSAQAAPQPAAAAPAPTHTHPVRAALPFTGVEVPIIAVTGLGLLMMGAGLRLRHPAAGI